MATSSCWDFGSGSQVNFTALEIPHQDITAYFATHLHADHVGDFAQVWIGSWAGGRSKPLVVYGPSGPEPKYGMRHFVEKQKESFAWDTDTRHGLLPDAGAEVEVHEFDFSKTGVVYDRNGVVIKSFPAIHIYDGPVSLRLEWNGLCFVFSGDTTPSKFMIDNAKGADLVVHEAFNTVSQLMSRSGYDEQMARGIGTIAHTAPSEVGHVFAKIQPRHAVIYHFFNDFDTAGEMERDVRKGWQGPAVTCAGSDGVQRHQGGHPGAHGGDAQPCLAEQEGAFVLPVRFAQAAFADVALACRQAIISEVLKVVPGMNRALIRHPEVAASLASLRYQRKTCGGLPSKDVRPAPFEARCFASSASG